MHILLAKKQLIPSFILAISTLFFSSLSLSYNPGLNYLPSRDNAGTGSINESQQGCVYRESDAAGGSWTVDDCDYVGAHYACYNGSEWQVLQALGTATNPGEPRDGNAGSQIKSVDLWDPVKADNLCKTHYGPSYFFSVPVNAEENEKLGAAITGIIAAKKRTWLYYYSNTQNIALSANYWLGNRTEYTNLLTTNLGNAGELGIGGVADCTLINRDTGLWQDAPCSEAHSFACYDSGAWLITATQESWKSGFSSCETEYGQQTLYAVPRDISENNAITVASLPSGGTNLEADYNKVWLNRSDLAYEEFFISNQTRQAWWGTGQPTNRGNADCTLVDSAGNWIAESCNGYVAYHACYLGNDQWQLTSDITDLKRSESALGFGLCKRLADNAEYRPPNTATSNSALAVLVDALPDNKFVWVNYSDQASEGYWKAESPFLDFVSIDGILEGDTEDCGYFSLETNNKRNWLAGQCYSGGAALEQGFACTNGFEWKIATEALVGGASLVSDLWKDGFTACEAAFGKDYQFAAPYGADQNSRLALALRLSGDTQVWMNINDARAEGEWVANGPVVNLSPVILSLTSQREVAEKQALNLSVTASDPETGNDVGLTYQWSIIGERVGLNNMGTDTVVTPVLGNANTPTVTIPAVDLINDDYYLDIQLQITDADVDAPATTTKVITLRIISPLRAAYDFNDFTSPALDISGHGHNLILDPSQVGIQAHAVGSDNYFAKLDSSDSFSIVGTGSDGLIVGDSNDEYTVMFRFKMDELPTDAFATFIQKGVAGSRQPGIFFNKAANNINYTNSTTNGQNASSNVSNEEVRLDQWMTAAYVKTPTEMIFYIDKAENNLDPAPWNTVPDSSIVLNGSSVDYASGDWFFGNNPFASEGITGGLDDIRIYNRALTAAELTTIFPDQPRGIFNFVNQQETGDENEVPAAVNEIVIPVSRTQGDDGQVSVGFKLVSDSAILDTDFRLKGDTSSGLDRGKGTLAWDIHDAVNKNITVELIGDNIREGTETFTIVLERLGNTEPELGNNSVIDVNIVDKTPNIYGAIGIAPTTAIENSAVDEGLSGDITVERVGSDSIGAFDVTYEIEALTAQFTGDSMSDFTITQAGFTTSGNSGTNVVIGSGRLSFPDRPAGAPVTRQTQTISFDAKADVELEFDESFIVRLLDVTDPGLNTLANPSNSAILGTMNTYPQVINDISPGRVSFVLANASVDEVDQDGGSNSVLIALERLGGDDGEMCVSLNLGASSADIPSDYTIAYLHPSASGQSDVFWSDQDSGIKLVQITAANDEVYDPGEIIEITWARKVNCNGSVSVLPYAAEPSDIGSTQVTINDYTTPVLLKFTETNYSVSELTATKTITVQATQTRLVNDPNEGDFTNGNRVNNNGFEVNLTRVQTSAIEGTHFGDLTPQEVITFLPGETVKTITVPIVDNCVATPSLTVGFGLAVPGSNALPASLIDVSSASSGLAITDASPSLSVNADATTAGLANPAEFKSGKWIVTADGTTSGGFESTSIKLQALNTTSDACPLTYKWKHVSVAPALPVAGVGKAGANFPSNFTTAAHLPSAISLISTVAEVNEFTLPFVVDDTVLNYQVEVKHPEKAAVTIDVPISIAANWSRLKNDRGWCTNIDGSTIGTSGNCSIDISRNFIFNPSTKQVIGQSLYGGEYGCWQAVNGGSDDVLYRACSTEVRQAITFSGSGDNIQSSDGYDMADTLSWGSNVGLRTLSGFNSGGQSANRKHWFWVN
jgi:hypothetical protein